MIYVIGIGVEGPQGLSQKALGIIKKAGLLAGAKRHLEAFGENNAKKAAVGADMDAVYGAISGHLKNGNGHVAVLATGDPLLFGIGSTLVKKFGKKNVSIMPNVSTVQTAFSKIKEGWGGAAVLSVHGRRGLGKAVGEISRHDRVALFTDSESPPSAIAKALLDAGLDYDAWVCESLGTKEERIRKGSLRAISKIKKFHPLNVLVLIRKGFQSQGGPLFGIPDDGFAHAGGMITKEEIRVIALSKLGLRDDSVVWDIGACSGSVGIEAARLARSGHVYAIEKDGKRCVDILKNAKRFKAGNFSLIKGTAPAGLEGLPAPDAVFVGGGGRDLSAILSHVGKSLRPGGKAVVNAISPNTAHAAFEFLRQNGFEDNEMVLVSVAKAKSLGTAEMLKAFNPVFIVCGRKA